VLRTGHPGRAGQIAAEAAGLARAAAPGFTPLALGPLTRTVTLVCGWRHVPYQHPFLPEAFRRRLEIRSNRKRGDRTSLQKEQLTAGDGPLDVLG
jgi:hypothetical protein